MIGKLDSQRKLARYEYMLIMTDSQAQIIGCMKWHENEMNLYRFFVYLRKLS